MAQFSKGSIPFAPNPNQAYKTPAKTAAGAVAKSAAQSAAASPKYQNGETIELPDIETEDEDEDEAEPSFGVASWANSPDLARALMEQERVRPEDVFGIPPPMKLEEVFSKKERHHKFRARTSSANWSGADKLTEEELIKDLRARDKMRRDGGWSYEVSKEMVD